MNVASGKALDVSGGNGANGTNVQQYVLNHTNAQLWDFVARQDGGYFIKSCLGEADASEHYCICNVITIYCCGVSVYRILCN